MEERLAAIASRFALDGEILDITPVGEGFINDTYRIRTGSGTPDYILQRKNGNIFKDVPAMMENIRKVTDHIRRKVLAAGGDPDREVLRVIPTRSGSLSHRDEAGEHWAATLFIDDTVTYDRADSPELARKGGIGIFRLEKSQLIALLGRLVLGKAAEGALLGGADHDIKDRFPAAQLHAAHAAAGHSPQCLRREGHEPVLAALAHDAEHPLLVVELAHQLDDQVALLGKGAVGTLEHIAGKL